MAASTAQYQIFFFIFPPLTETVGVKKHYTCREYGIPFIDRYAKVVRAPDQGYFAAQNDDRTTDRTPDVAFSIDTALQQRI